MKYLEELSNGDHFLYNNGYYITSIDFNKSRYRKCINLNDGTQRWLSPDTIVENIVVFTLDNESNLIPIKTPLK